MPSEVNITRPLIVPVLVAAGLALAVSPASAQQARSGEQLGLRYLSWAGKPAASSTDGLRRPVEAAPRTATASVTTAPTALASRPNRYGAPYASSNGLTPASAWIGRPAAISAQPQPQPQAQADPVAAPGPALRPMPHLQTQPQPAAGQQTATAPEYDPGPGFQRQDAYYAAPPQVREAMHTQPQPTTMPAPPEIPTAVEAAADPMAPRRDALIFRMGQPTSSAATQPQAQAQAQAQAPTAPAQAMAQQTAAAPPRLGARYYSVHREAGHAPDPMILPESAFIGGPATDLAEPPPVPMMTRTVNGRVQAVVANQDPALP